MQVLLEFVEETECGIVRGATVGRHGVVVGERSDATEPFPLGIVVLHHHVYWIVHRTEWRGGRSASIGCRLFQLFDEGEQQEFLFLHMNGHGSCTFVEFACDIEQFRNIYIPIEFPPFLYGTLRPLRCLRI